MISDLEEIEDISELPDKLIGDKTTDRLGNSCQSRTKSEIIKCINYKNPKRQGKAMLVL